MGKLRRLLHRIALLIHRISHPDVSSRTTPPQNAAPPPSPPPIARQLSYTPRPEDTTRWRNRNGIPTVRSNATMGESGEGAVSRGRSLLERSRSKRVKREVVEEGEEIELEELNVEYWMVAGVLEGDAGRAAFYRSTDAVAWEMFTGAPVQVSLDVDEPIRDPYLFRTSTGTFYLAFSGLSDTSTDPVIRIFSSTSLQDWTEHATIPITLQNAKLAQFPNFFYDPQTSSIHIIVTLTLTTTLLAPYIMSSTSPTLQTFSTPQLVSGLGTGYSQLALMYKERPSDHHGLYHAFFRNEKSRYIEHATSENAAGPYILRNKGNFAGWGKVEQILGVVKMGEKYRIVFTKSRGRVCWAESVDLEKWGKMEGMKDGMIVPGGGGVLRTRALER